MSSPTSRSTELLRSRGWTVAKVEYWQPYWRDGEDGVSRPTKQGVRRDLWGCDLIACQPGIGILLVQTTSASNARARVHKLAEIPEALEWLRSGGRIEVHGWRKAPIKRGAKAKKWVCNEIPVDEQILEEARF